METITHREMRNNSAEVLRRVEAGEMLQVTNNGHPTALIVPIGYNRIDAAIATGGARPARTGVDELRLIRRATTPLSTREIIEDARGKW